MTRGRAQLGPFAQELAECLRRKGNLTDIVAGIVGRLKRALERISLFRRRLQFQLDSELHLAALLLLNVVVVIDGRDAARMWPYRSAPMC